MASKKISQLPSGSANVPLSGQTAVVYSGITHQQTLSSLRQNLVDSGSHFFSGSQYINGNLVVTGSITAQEFIISSSVSHITVQTVSGSSNFGDTLSDAHNFTGSVKITGSLNVNGATHLGSTVENILPINNPATEFTHNFINGSIAYVSEATSDFTINLTNVPSNNNTAIGLIVILEQGLTAYKITGININSSPISISWYGGSQPSGTTNSTDIFAFSLIKINNAWRVLGQKTTF